MKRLYAFAFIAMLAVGCGSTEPAANNGNNGENNGNNGNNGSNNGNNGTAASNNGTVTPNNGTGGGNNGTAGTNNGTVVNDGTWHGGVRAIVESNCADCHKAGGIGPFPLTTFEEVQPLAALIKMTVVSKEMPPWPPSDDCGPTYKYDRSLSDEQIAAISDWVDAGTPLGDPAVYVAPTETTLPDLGTPDFVIDTGTDYVAAPPDGGIDDYHCFIIEHDFQEDVFINAYDTVPGDRSVVHHMLFWQVEGSELANARSRETTPGSGYTCFGGSGFGDTGLIGGWVPGAVATKYNDNQGFRVPQDSFFIVQIHYNTVNGAKPDRTKINLHMSPETPRIRLGMYPLPAQDLFLAAGDANAKASIDFDLPIPLDVYGVFPHMHTRGTRIKVTANDECLVDVPDWDFNWQGFYFFNEPQQASGNVRLECEYDNSAANQPAGQTPRDVRWGEGTFDEMCLNYFVIQELPF